MKYEPGTWPYQPGLILITDCLVDRTPLALFGSAELRWRLWKSSRRWIIQEVLKLVLLELPSQNGAPYISHPRHLRLCIWNCCHAKSHIVDTLPRHRDTAIARAYLLKANCKSTAFKGLHDPRVVWFPHVLSIVHDAHHLGQIEPNQFEYIIYMTRLYGYYSETKDYINVNRQ